MNTIDHLIQIKAVKVIKKQTEKRRELFQLQYNDNGAAGGGGGGGGMMMMMIMSSNNDYIIQRVTGLEDFIRFVYEILKK